jgi:peroxiredoxin Q/BCP
VTKLKVGDAAPDFTLPDQDGKDVSLRDFRGSRVLIYFYPRDDTPGCTKEACQFNERLPDFQQVNVPVIGISADGAASHVRFRNKYGLRFPLLTDSSRTVMARYGAYGEKMMYGKPTTGVIRSTFLIDPQGRIEQVWHNVKADGHAAKVLETLVRA